MVLFVKIKSSARLITMATIVQLSAYHKIHVKHTRRAATVGSCSVFLAGPTIRSVISVWYCLPSTHRVRRKAVWMEVAVGTNSAAALPLIPAHRVRHWSIHAWIFLVKTAASVFQTLDTLIAPVSQWKAYSGRFGSKNTYFRSKALLGTLEYSVKYRLTHVPIWQCAMAMATVYRPQTTPIIPAIVSQALRVSRVQSKSIYAIRRLAWTKELVFL